MQKAEKFKAVDLKDRTKKYALRIIRLYTSLPKSKPAQVIGAQILRSGTSVGANYREACRARSSQEFISKLGISLQELEETLYWLEILVEGKLVPKNRLTLLMKETDELLAILVSSINKAKIKK